MTILGEDTYTVTRTTSGTWVDGKHVPGSSTTFPVDAGIQPVQPRDLQLLPEGSRSDANYSMYCDDEQSVLDLGDRVAYKGGSCLIVGAADWTDHGVLPWRLYLLGEVTSV